MSVYLCSPSSPALSDSLPILACLFLFRPASLVPRMLPGSIRECVKCAHGPVNVFKPSGLLHVEFCLTLFSSVFFFNTYFYLFIWLRRHLGSLHGIIAACKISFSCSIQDLFLSCSMRNPLVGDTWDLVPRPGIEPGPPVLGA